MAGSTPFFAMLQSQSATLRSVALHDLSAKSLPCNACCGCCGLMDPGARGVLPARTLAHRCPNSAVLPVLVGPCFWSARRSVTSMHGSRTPPAEAAIGSDWRRARAWRTAMKVRYTRGSPPISTATVQHALSPKDLRRCGSRIQSATLHSQTATPALVAPLSRKKPGIISIPG